MMNVYDWLSGRVGCRQQAGQAGQEGQADQSVHTLQDVWMS
jgi:hypothetical protein